MSSPTLHRRGPRTAAILLAGLMTTIAGCAARPAAHSTHAAAAPTSRTATATPRPTATRHRPVAHRPSATPTRAHRRPHPVATTRPPAPTHAPRPRRTAVHRAVATTAPPKPRPTHRPAPPPAPKLLPDLMADTHGAGQIVAVTNNGGADTSATVTAYQRSGGAWHQVLGPYTALIGASGFSRHVSEETVASPIGFFTLSQAFGNQPDPGSGLPYRHVQYGDVWVDQSSSPNYNTMQTGDSSGAAGTGEKLWEVVPSYNYAAVIDYNRWPATPGAGSAFFLHVTNGQPTQGCVALAPEHVTALLRWLDPGQHPRIAMGPHADVLGM